ncbi:MAG: hypothetical protein ACF8GE_00365 [Phycisphaerales bacterium JB043]
MNALARTTTTALALLVCLVTTTSQLAQQGNDFAAPSPNVPEQPQLWLYITTSLVIGAAVILLSIMPSKRTDNQD